MAPGPEQIGFRMMRGERVCDKEQEASKEECFVATIGFIDNRFVVTKLGMNIEFDADKDASNRKKHGLSLADAARLDLTQVTIVPDQRRDYGEARFQAYGRIDGRLHVLADTLRPGAIRAISFRKANQREEERYGSRS